jgi:alpha-D-xyloside xylohydrolase
MRLMNSIRLLTAIIILVMVFYPAGGQLQHMGILNDPVDISKDFKTFSNLYFVADHMIDFDPATGKGKVVYNRHAYTTSKAFSNMNAGLRAVDPNEFPSGEYAVSPALPFSIEFISSRTVRLRAQSGVVAAAGRHHGSPMLVSDDLPSGGGWKYSGKDGKHIYTSVHGSVTISERPWKVEFLDENGKLLTSTNHFSDNTAFYTPVLPFSWVRRSDDYSRSFSATFNLFPGEKIFGFGEMFTQFDKRGQKVILGIDDAHGSQNESSHKPAPFFMSNRGYGMFIHTSSPVTCDVGKYFSGVHSMYIGDEELDLFVFLGQPKHILDEYTGITGKASMPPLWSFGFWMSRITYFSEADAREVADKLRANRIPSDVIHLDTGWFETDWRCDYRFAESRFDDPRKMIKDLKDQGFHISLWQLPYFVPRNVLFPEIVEKGLYIRNQKGNIPFEDAILDFTNPAAVEWYREKIRGLLEMGVGAIKVDFGEAAPWKGIYHNGRTGFYEHNLYPTRYNQIVADLTREIRGENIIWARSGWAGSQRYPVHWGGDAGNTNSAMAGTLRGGLSIGLSGYSFWSHDVGGFVTRTPEDLYRRWLAFGIFSSHTRAHGHPPKEPWEFGEEFMDYFRNALNMRYQLMPYIYAQARHSAENGLPMMRALFIEYPDDPGAWKVDDQYLFGSDFLVAPIFENVTSRDVYLPGGHRWIDYQSGKIYNQGWNHIEVGPVEAVVLVREGAAIPHIRLAQSTMDMDWTDIEIKVFGTALESARALVCLPSDNILAEINLRRRGGWMEVAGNPLKGRPRLRVTEMEVKNPGSAGR